MKTVNFSRAAIALLMMLLTTTTAWATVTWDGGAGTTGDPYYVNMSNGTKCVDLSDSNVKTFMVYDDGGPDAGYSANYGGTLIITAPTGYKINVAGSINTEESFDFLTFFDGTDPDYESTIGRTLLEASGVTSISTTSETGSMIIQFYSDSGTTSDGFALTVTLEAISGSHAINIADCAGGCTLTASPATADAGQTVTLTSSPAEGYVLGALSVRDADGHIVDRWGDMLWYTGETTGTFTMPDCDVTVTPVFTNVLTADGGLTVNMPVKGLKNVTVPSGVTSFKVYDYGGPDCNYSDNYSGKLLLTAPEGCVLQVSGTITTQNGDGDYLTVSDFNNTVTGDYLVYHVSSTSDDVATAIPTVVSTEQTIEIDFYSDDAVNYAGLDLTVTVISPGTDYSVTVSNADTSKGTMTASTTTAQLGTEITLTATPAAGYVLSDLSVTCGGRAVKTNWNVWTNSAAFKMPNGDVTVTPTFTNDLTKTSLAVNLPVKGKKYVTIPEGVASFKIYDDGGPTGNYTAYCIGTLNLTAPEGSLLRFTGSVVGPEDKFFLWIDYNKYTTTKNDIDVKSTNNNLNISLLANSYETTNGNTLMYGDTGAGLDLTATVLYPVTIADDIANGTVTTDKTHAAADETVTLTVTPATDCTIGSVCINGQPLEAVGGVYSFTMPARRVSVTATFRKLLTNADITVADIPNQTYSGMPLTPEISVTDANGGTPLTLTEGEDYTVSYETATGAGDYTVTLTGIGNYDGTTTKTFTIVPKKLTVDMVSDISPQTYTGLEICPGISVTDGEKELAPDTDYSVYYSNNVNAGTATATITGKGNYGGTVEKTFEIAYPIVTTSYMDASGTLHDNIAAIPLANTMTTLAAGTYVVNSNVTFTSGITLNGNVTLILEDNCTMEANGGIVVSSDNSLTIYAQSDGGSMGVLNAEVPTSDDYSAGIGGSNGQSCGTVTINGGAITARGGDNGAGIGGGSGGSGGTIVINGGAITARGGDNGAGIGGGSRGSGGTIVINGGSVKAYGNSTSDNLGGGAGIGGGTGGAAGNITINGGTVTARGNWYVTGIGGGINGTGGNITINGGKVTAEGGYDGNNGINGTIILGWTNATDRIYASSYVGTVTLSKRFAFDANGTVTLATTANIAYQTLQPAALVTFDANGGSDVAPQLLYIGTAATAPTAPTLTGYEFGGWKLADADYDFATTVTEDITLTAAWTENVLELDNASNNTDIIAAAAATGKTYNRVTLTGRTLYKDGKWNTLCLPFDVVLEGSPLAGATVMELDATGDYDGKHTGLDATDGTLYLYFKSATTIEAGKPYIIRWGTPDSHPSTDIDAPVFSGVTVSTDAPTGVTLTDGKYIVSAQNSGLNTVQFIGTYSPTDIYSPDKDNLYLGSDGNSLYYPWGDSMTEYYLNACRAYFHVDLTGAANIRAFVLNFGDGGETESQGISDAPRLNDKGEMINEKEAGAWYDLQGRRIRSALPLGSSKNGQSSARPKGTLAEPVGARMVNGQWKKGLYINNGRKVVIK